LFVFSGCSPALEYKAGLYTKSVTGVIKTEQVDPAPQPFVLVLDFHRTLLETAEGFLQRVTAFIVYPDAEGNYSVPFGTDTAKLELTFFARYSSSIVQQFSRSLGIGGYRYDVDLKEDKNWRNSYFLLIKPTLIEFITEKRYLMNQTDRRFLGEWLAVADERF
jgi:hypothetical protein